MAGQRHDHFRPQPWIPGGQAERRDPLLRHKPADQLHEPPAARERPLVHREQLALGTGLTAAGRRPPLPGRQRRPSPGNTAAPGDQCAVARGDPAHHGRHSRLVSLHQRLAKTAGLQRGQKDEAARERPCLLRLVASLPGSKSNCTPHRSYGNSLHQPRHNKQASGGTNAGAKRPHQSRSD